MIHVCYTVTDLDGTYTKYAGASLCSMFENTREWVTVHFLHNHTLSADNRRYLMQLVRSYGQQIVFIDIEKVYKERMQKLIESIQWMKAHIHTPGVFFSEAIWYRLLIGDLLSDLDRVIYLDSDTIVNLDIGEFWREEGGASGLAAVPDYVIQEKHLSDMVKLGLYPEDKYFNAGVLLIDIQKFRKVKNLLERGTAFLKEHDMVDYNDQDILNYFYGREARILPDKYNAIVTYEMMNGREKIGNCIYHYAGQRYAIDTVNNYHRLFLEYFTKTPWCNAEFLSNMAKNTHRHIRSQMLAYTNVIAGMNRIVIGSEGGKEKITDLLSLKEHEAYYTLKEFNQRGLRLEPNEILMFFLKPEEFESVKKHLIACGCTENVHFIDGNIFLYRNAAQDAKILRES